MADAVEDFDAGLRHPARQPFGELDIVAHFAAQGLRREVAPGRHVIVLANDEQYRKVE